jgi:hypothetical protein
MKYEKNSTDTKILWSKQVHKQNNASMYHLAIQLQPKNQQEKQKQNQLLIFYKLLTSIAKKK